MPLRHNRVPIRLTDAELSKVRARAHDCGRKLAPFVRECALGASPRLLRRQADDDLLYVLGQTARMLSPDGDDHSGQAMITRHELYARVTDVLARLITPEP